MALRPAQFCIYSVRTWRATGHSYIQHWPQFVLPGTLTKELIASLAGEFKTRSWRPEISVYCDRKQRRFEVGSKTGALTKGYERQGRVQDSACRNPSCWGLFIFACMGSTQHQERPWCNSNLPALNMMFHSIDTNPIGYTGTILFTPYA